MAETLISPGVLARENDSTFVAKRPVNVGAAIIGPTVKGPVEVPTVVTTYNEFVNKFGTTFLSGSEDDQKTYSYFTSIAAYNYFVNGGLSLLVARVVSGSYLPATASIFTDKTATTASANLNITPFHTEASVFSTASVTLDITPFYNEVVAIDSSSFIINNITFTITSSNTEVNTSTVIFVPSGSNAITTAANVVLSLNNSSSISPYNTDLQYITASNTSATLELFSLTGAVGNSYYIDSASITSSFSGGAGPSSSSFSVNGITFTLTGDVLSNTSNTIFVPTGSSATNSAIALATALNASSSIAPYSASLQHVIASNTTNTLDLFSSNGLTGNSYYIVSGSVTTYFTGGTNHAAFVVETLSEGALMNSNGPTGSNNILLSGSADNLRWQIVNSSKDNGTFDLLVRRGDDNSLQPTVLETWTNLNLDPNSPNYVARAIGNQVEAYDPTDNQMEVNGEFAVRSNYIRIKQVNYTTPNYFDNNGVAKPQYTASLPVNSNGAFGGAEGTVRGGANFYHTIDNNDTQGLISDNYNNMISLLANTDDYKFNILMTPGLVDAFPSHTGKISTLITNTQDRGDNIYIIDPVGYGTSLPAVVSQAASRNTSYAAEYWPWCQILDPSSGNLVWVPASTLIPGVYALNDTVAEPWFAPAGINRGGLGQVVRVEQKLSQANRDALYNGKVNPIATFPGSGIVVYGQKTLQTRASALDRVNVRRLLIALKSYISQVALNLVFEQNTIATRNQFLAQVNPYLTSVQQRQGLYAFKVVMDDSNNTPDVIDRNELIGQIYLQPTKTAEFIYLDFNITPTGATFPG
jgi:hypothetical protein